MLVWLLMLRCTCAYSAPDYKQLLLSYRNKLLSGSNSTKFEAGLLPTETVMDPSYEGQTTSQQSVHSTTTMMPYGDEPATTTHWRPTAPQLPTLPSEHERRLVAVNEVAADPEEMEGRYQERQLLAKNERSFMIPEPAFQDLPPPPPTVKEAITLPKKSVKQSGFFWYVLSDGLLQDHHIGDADLIENSLNELPTDTLDDSLNEASTQKEVASMPYNTDRRTQRRYAVPKVSSYTSFLNSYNIYPSKPWQVAPSPAVAVRPSLISQRINEHAPFSGSAPLVPGGARTEWGPTASSTATKKPAFEFSKILSIISGIWHPDPDNVWTTIHFRRRPPTIRS